MDRRLTVKCTGTIILLLTTLFLISCQNSDKTKNRPIPQKWIEQWQDPSANMRPLQIVHDLDLRNQAKYLRDSCGLGGVVCNVMDGESYLKSDEAWIQFVNGFRSMRENNLRVWIYDEKGYPSLSAGGRVLERQGLLAEPGREKISC